MKTKCIFSFVQLLLVAALGIVGSTQVHAESTPKPMIVKMIPASPAFKSELQESDKDAAIQVFVQQSCSSMPVASRSPSSNSTPSDSTFQVQEFIEKVSRTISSRNLFTDQTCSTVLREWTEWAFNYDPPRFARSRSDKSGVDKAKAFEIIRSLATLQVNLRSRLLDVDLSNRNCENYMRSSLRYVREAQDSIIDSLFENGLIVAGSKKIFAGGFPYTIHFDQMTTDSTPVDVRTFDLKAGDVILVRGQTFVSALIARIGDEEGNFAHLALVAQDSKSNQLFLMEALIENGIIATPLEKWLENQREVRALVYRYPEAEVAEQAAQKMYSEWESKGRDVPYDFKMLVDDHSQFFCSEVIRHAFEMAGVLNVPRYMTSFSKLKGSKLLKDLGVEAEATFAPSDIELDGRFNLVAEYRLVEQIPKSDADPKFAGFTRLQKIREQDVVIVSLFTWMKERNYFVKDNLGATGLAHFAKAVRALGLFKSSVRPEMPASAIALLIKLQKISRVAEAERISELQVNGQNGAGPHNSFREGLLAMEKWRIQDCLAWKKYIKFSAEDSSLKPQQRRSLKLPLFHLRFSPNVLLAETCTPIADLTFPPEPGRDEYHGR